MSDRHLRSRKRQFAIPALGLLLAFVGAACSGAGGGGGGGGTTTITVGSVDNPSMTDLKKLVPDFESAHSGIKVNIVTLPQDQIRQQVTQDVATQSGKFDLFTIGTYEVPLWAKLGWLQDLAPYIAKDSSYDPGDLIPGIKTAVTYQNDLYAVPFYGESAMLMYRKDLLAAKGITMPEHPTWQQVADAAAKVADKSKGVAGICLRGLKGWGEVFAPLTTVVNTFGGTWFESDWTAKVNAPEFTQAVTFYTDL